MPRCVQLFVRCKAGIHGPTGCRCGQRIANDMRCGAESRFISRSREYHQGGRIPQGKGGSKTDRSDAFRCRTSTGGAALPQIQHGMARTGTSSDQNGVQSNYVWHMQYSFRLDAKNGRRRNQDEWAQSCVHESDDVLVSVMPALWCNGWFQCGAQSQRNAASYGPSHPVYYNCLSATRGLPPTESAKVWIRLTCQEYSASAKFDSVNTLSGLTVGSRPVDVGGRRYCECPKQRGVADGGFCRVRGEISGDLIIIVIQRRLLAVGSSSGQNLKYWRLWGQL